MRNSYPQKPQNKGFTIVELIVIVVVIGILAAITIVSYNAVTENARKEQVATSARTLNAALGKYKSERGSYPDGSQVGAVIQGAGLKEEDVQYTYNATSGSFCFTVSEKGVSANITSGNSSVKEGGCAGHGVNGQAAVVNLAADPNATSYSASNTIGWRNDRYVASGTYSLITGVSDGPVSGLNTYARMEFTQAIGAGRGFHFAGNPETTTPSAAGVPLEVGKTYTFSAYARSMRTSGGTVSFNVGVRFADASNAWVGSTAFGSSVIAAAGSPTTNPGPWVRPFVTVTVPAGATRAQAYMRETAAPTHAVGDRIEGTGLMITESSTLMGYGSGSTASWIWDGTPNASTSRGPAQ